MLPNASDASGKITSKVTASSSSKRITQLVKGEQDSKNMVKLPPNPPPHNIVKEIHNRRSYHLQSQDEQ